MGLVSGHRCLACKKLHPAVPPYIGTCPACGENVEVVCSTDHLEASEVRMRLGASSRRDMWRYEALLPVEEATPRSPLAVGWTPLYEVPALGRALGHESLLLKDETRNPSASFKDRASAVALAKAIELKSSVITGASTGNAGSSMACLAASMGLSPVIFVPEQAPRAKVAQLALFGATVVAVRGTYDDAFDLCLEATRRYGWYNRNTGYNPYTREGKKTCAFEILEQLEWQVPDVVAVSVGDGNIISGLWKGFREFHDLGLVSRRPRMLAVQSTKSNAVARAVAEGLELPPCVQASTIADSISVDRPRDGRAAVAAIRDSNGIVIQVDDEAVLHAMALTARASGVFAEPAGAAAVAGVAEASRQGLLDPSWRVVVVVTGSGLKDIDAALQVAPSPTVVDPDPSVLTMIGHDPVRIA